MVTTYTAKAFINFMEQQRKDFLEKSKIVNNRTENTKEDYQLADSYFPKASELKKYGYYHYNSHTKFYQWTKKR